MLTLRIATLCALVAASLPLLAVEPVPLPRTAEAPLQSTVGESVPSEDDVIKDFHSLGLVQGHANIFRSACPVRDLAKAPTTLSDDQKLSEARARLRHLHDLGIRTIISFEDPSKVEAEDIPFPGDQKTPMRPSVALERAAAESEGMRFLSRPMANADDNSLENMSDAAVLKLLDANSREILEAADSGGVLFHCSAGHDRSGIVAAFIRMKYQHWPVEEAIAEMRRYGHNWPKFSRDGGQSSWHEAHLRAISKLLDVRTPPAHEPGGSDAAESHSPAGAANR
jgi:Tyrosine phosphatase family